MTTTAAAFPTHRAPVRPGLELAFVREGIGGTPLLLVHGWPETKRIWWRNIGPLAAAGFEVIAPDLRGFGDSDLAPDGNYETAFGARAVSEPARFFEPVPTPTLVLVGPADHVVDPTDFIAKAAVAFPERVGPLVVPGAGHFLQWEQAEVLNQSLRWLCGDLLAAGRADSLAR
jgi:pimeloyl-ACP methyl ester carboxylesterase